MISTRSSHRHWIVLSRLAIVTVSGWWLRMGGSHCTQAGAHTPHVFAPWDPGHNWEWAWKTAPHNTFSVHRSPRHWHKRNMSVKMAQNILLSPIYPHSRINQINHFKIYNWIENTDPFWFDFVKYIGWFLNCHYNHFEVLLFKVLYQ